VSSTQCLVRASNSTSVTVNDVSNSTFTIKPAVTVITPNGDNGVTIWGGCTVTSITFDRSPAWNTYLIEYSINNGSTWTTIVNNWVTSANPATYNWSIPNTPSSQVRVRVTPVSATSYGDQSDNVFTITKPVTIIQPNFGGVMQVGTVYPIKWQSDGISNIYDIFYSTNGGTSYTNIVMGYNTSINTYSWTVPATVSNNCKIIVRDNINTCKTDTSDQVFIIQNTPPAITLLNPNGGDTLRGCSTYTINWTDALPSGSYNLAYSINSGSSWTSIVTNYTTSAHSYNWIIPNTINSSNVLLRVQSATTLTTLDLSDALLTIMNGTLNATPSSTAICSGNSLQLNTTGGVNYSWSPSISLSASNISNPIASPTVSTIYTVQSVNGSCVLSNTVNVTVSPAGAPVTVTITPSPSNSVCPGTLVTFTTSISNGGVNPTYQWFVNGVSNGVTSATYTTNTLSNNDVVSCLVTSDLSCVSNNPALSNSVTISIVSGQTPSVTISASPSNTICPGTLVTFSASPVFGGTTPTYVWKLNGATVGGSSATYTNNTLANGNTVSVIMTSNASCLSTSTASSIPMAIVVNTTPAVPSAISGNTVVCANSSYTYSTAAVSGATSYNWTLPSGWTGSSTTNTIAVTTLTNGGVISVQASNACGTSSTRILSVSMTVPTVSITGASSVCFGSSAILTATGSATSYTWNTTQTSNTISVSPTITTTYSVIGMDAIGCQNSASKTVTVNALPIISVTNPTICGGATATVTASGASTYTWNTGSVGANLVVTPSVTTIYTVTGTSSLSCVGSSTASVNVGSTPSISVNTSTICAGNSATLTASGVTTYTWNTGATTSSIIVTPSTTTVYSVSGQQSGCTTIASKTSTVVVNSLPTISITANSSSICVGQSTSLTVSGSVTSYTWNTSAITSSITVSPTVTTTYSVTGNDANGCQNTVAKNIVVNSLPTISVTSPTVCAGGTITVSASGASTYTWNTGAIGSNLVVSPMVNTNYTVTGTSTQGCANTSTTSVIVDALPSISVNTETICAGSSATITASGVSTYTWNTSETTSSIVVTPTSTSVYTVSGNLAGCSVVVSNTTSVNVNALPTISISASNSVICEGQTSDLTVSGSVSSYTWNTSAITPSISVSPMITTTYSVIGTDINGCENSASSVITVNPLPILSIVNSTICAGGTATVSASGASTYSWNTGATGSDLIVSPTANTDYTVTGTSAFGCVNTETASVTITATPSISVNSVTLCSGNTATLTATGVSSYTWNTGNNTASINVSPSSSTVYTVSGFAAGCSLQVTETATVEVISSPTVSAVTSNTLLCAGQTATLTASGANTYTWSTTGIGSSIAVNPPSTVTYTVTGEAGNGCVNSAVITQSVSPCTGISNAGQFDEELNVYPNPFKDLVTIKYSSSIAVRLTLVNALGGVVFETEMKDGKAEINIINQASGIYFIKIYSQEGMITKKIIKE
ncbi:MAG: hypothetical protein C0448_12490, partial [Sphingobacteriaceae bacterium]|nr:hypothetical protein [Sphingobacteriaceae bacterium]